VTIVQENLIGTDIDVFVINMAKKNMDKCRIKSIDVLCV
jgi:23S rRNA G2445 N2-methylase RlmL